MMQFHDCLNRSRFKAFPWLINHCFVVCICVCMQLMRLFKGKPVWTAYNRPQEDHPARKEYIKSLTEKTGVPLAAH